MRAGRHPLSFEQLYTVGDHGQHLTALNYIKARGHPCIVIAASGMCAGGRMVNYLKALIGTRAPTSCSSATRPPVRPAGISRPTARKAAGWSWTASVSTSAPGAHHQRLFSPRRPERPGEFCAAHAGQTGHIRIVHGDDEAKRELQGQRAGARRRGLIPGARARLGQLLPAASHRGLIGTARRRRGRARR